MMRITLTEKSYTADNIFTAELCFEDLGGRRHLVTIKPPFTAQQEAELEWYFEQYLVSPFVENARYEEGGASVRAYGIILFEQVFGERKAYSDYQRALDTEFELTILGSPAFHALHWETLYDSEQTEPLILQHDIVRKPLQLEPAQQVIFPQESSSLNILLVVARLESGKGMKHRTVSRPLIEMVQDNQLPVQFKILRPATWQALVQHLETVRQQQGEGFYHAMHFDVQGEVFTAEQVRVLQQIGNMTFYGQPNDDTANFEGERGFIFLNHEQEAKKSRAISTLQLSQLLQAHGIPLLILNTVPSTKQTGTASKASLCSRAYKQWWRWHIQARYQQPKYLCERFMHSYSHSSRY